MMFPVLLSTLLATSPADVKSGGVVVVPGQVTTTTPTKAVQPIVCPPGRFVVLIPHSDEPITYYPPDVVQTYPTGSVIVGVKWDEPAGAKPKPYTFPEAKGAIGFLMPERDTTILVLRNGASGQPPPIPQSIDVKTGQGPQPPPPGPTPTPTPPDPKPDGTSPFVGVNGLHVLIVFDRTKARPQEQISVTSGANVRDYLEKHCTQESSPEPGTDGKAYRIYGHNVDISRAPKVWADAFAKKGGDDWILIGDGKTGYSGPLPKNETEALELLKKYGGK